LPVVSKTTFNSTKVLKEKLLLTKN